MLPGGAMAVVGAVSRSVTIMTRYPFGGRDQILPQSGVQVFAPVLETWGMINKKQIGWNRNRIISPV